MAAWNKKTKLHGFTATVEIEVTEDVNLADVAKMFQTASETIMVENVPLVSRSRITSVAEILDDETDEEED